MEVGGCTICDGADLLIGNLSIVMPECCPFTTVHAQSYNSIFAVWIAQLHIREKPHHREICTWGTLDIPLGALEWTDCPWPSAFESCLIRQIITTPFAVQPPARNGIGGARWLLTCQKMGGAKSRSQGALGKESSEELI